ncbi:MAG: site-specific integrase [bacterium]|nr:site-specific integrase [bacterium]
MDALFKQYLRRKGLVERSINQHLRRLVRVLPYDVDTFTEFVSNLEPANSNKFCQTAKHWCDFKKIPYDTEVFKCLAEKSKKRPTFSDDQILAFLSIQTKYTPFWYILAFHGCRPGEARALCQEDIDLSSKTITISQSKTGKGRVIAINPMAFTVVSDYLKIAGDKLFPVSDTTMYKDFKMRIKKMGLTKSVSPYSFRHSLATRLLMEDASLFAVQDILGHSDPKTTRVYYHGNLKAQTKAFRKDTILRSVNLQEAVQDTWEELRSKLQDMKVNPIKVSLLEKTLWDCIESN